MLFYVYDPAETFNILSGVVEVQSWIGKIIGRAMLLARSPRRWSVHVVRSIIVASKACQRPFNCKTQHNSSLTPLHDAIQAPEHLAASIFFYNPSRIVCFSLFSLIPCAQPDALRDVPTPTSCFMIFTRVSFEPHNHLATASDPWPTSYNSNG